MLRFGGASRGSLKNREDIRSSISASHSKSSPATNALSGRDWFCVDISQAWNTFDTSGISAEGNDLAVDTSHSTSHIHPMPFGTTMSETPDGTSMEGCTRSISLATGTDSTEII